MRCLLLVIYLGVHTVAIVTPPRHEFFIGDELGRDFALWEVRFAASLPPPRSL